VGREVNNLLLDLREVCFLSLYLECFLVALWARAINRKRFFTIRNTDVWSARGFQNFLETVVNSTRVQGPQSLKSFPQPANRQRWTSRSCYCGFILDLHWTHSQKVWDTILQLKKQCSKRNLNTHFWLLVWYGMVFQTFWGGVQCRSNMKPQYGTEPYPEFRYTYTVECQFICQRFDGPLSKWSNIF
jgi:hypothetical protein